MSNNERTRLTTSAGEPSRRKGDSLVGMDGKVRLKLSIWFSSAENFPSNPGAPKIVSQASYPWMGSVGVL